MHLTKWSDRPEQGSLSGLPPDGWAYRARHEAQRLQRAIVWVLHFGVQRQKRDRLARGTVILVIADEAPSVCAARQLADLGATSTWGSGATTSEPGVIVGDGYVRRDVNRAGFGHRSLLSGAEGTGRVGIQDRPGRAGSKIPGARCRS